MPDLFNVGQSSLLIHALGGSVTGYRWSGARDPLIQFSLPENLRKEGDPVEYQVSEPDLENWLRERDIYPGTTEIRIAEVINQVKSLTVELKQLRHLVRSTAAHLDPDRFRLCMAEETLQGAILYFASGPAIGDDWYTRPARSNAGPPYAWTPERGTDPYIVIPVDVWHSESQADLDDLADDLIPELPYSAEEINKMQLPWLMTAFGPLRAGVTLRQACAFLGATKQFQYRIESPLVD